MSGPETRRAVAEAAPLGAARAAAGAAEGGVEPARGETGGVGSGDPFVADLRRGGLLRLLVLHFLTQGPSYGNQLMERVAAASDGLIVPNPNTMYPLLRKLEADGLLVGGWEHPERRSRRFYELTEAGEAERARLAGEVGPRLDAVAAGVASIRRELGA